MPVNARGYPGAILRMIKSGQHVRMQFDVSGRNREQKELFHALKSSMRLAGVTSLGPVELE